MLFSEKGNALHFSHVMVSKAFDKYHSHKKEKINFVSNCIPLSQITRENEKGESMIRTKN